MTRSNSLLFIGLIFSFYGTAARAAEEARLLPKGISRFRVAGVETNDVASRFGSDGSLGVIPGANRTFTMANMAALSPDIAQLRDTLNALSPGMGDNLNTTNIYQGASVREQVYGAAFEYGISSRWNFGIRLRMTDQHIRTNFSTASTNNAAQIQAALAKNGVSVPALDAGLKRVAALDTSSWQNLIFSSRGYSPQNVDRMDLGYTEIGAKYLIYDNDKWYLTSLQSGIRIPTGRDPSLTNPYDLGTGDNYWGTAVQWLEEFRAPIDGVSFGTSLRGDYYFTDTKIYAVPKNSNDPLPSLIPSDGQVQSVTRSPGQRIEGEVSSTYAFPGHNFSVWGAYQFQRKWQDTFSGPGDLYYQGLSANTDYGSTNAEVGGEFSTINFYRRGKFSMPFQVSLLYNKTLTGFNMPDASYVRADLKFYF